MDEMILIVTGLISFFISSPTSTALCFNTAGDSLLDQSKHHAEFSTDAGFNCWFNLKDKLALELSIILNLMLIVASDDEFHAKHHAENNLNNSEL